MGVGVSLAVLGVVALGAAGYAPDPDFTLCPFRLLTGLPCPFCGLTHSLFALGAGHVGRSFAFSPLGPVVLVLALAFLTAVAVARVRVASVVIPRSAPRVLLVLVLATWAVRLALSF